MTTPSSLMTPEAYVTACGGCCPVCRSGQTAGECFNTAAAQVWQRVRCLDCEAMWTDVYALQGYEDLERPVQVPAEEHARLLREVLRNRDLNPSDVLDLAAGVEAALLALPALQEHIRTAWHEEQQRAAEEDEEREEPSTDSDPQAFLVSWHHSEDEGRHWSSPHGCHAHCPACGADASPPSVATHTHAPRVPRGGRP